MDVANGKDQSKEHVEMYKVYFSFFLSFPPSPVLILLMDKPLYNINFVTLSAVLFSSLAAGVSLTLLLLWYSSLLPVLE